MPMRSAPGPSESTTSGHSGMLATAGRGLQGSYNARMLAQQPQQQGGFNAAQARVEVYLSFVPCIWMYLLSDNVC